MQKTDQRVAAVAALDLRSGAETHEMVCRFSARPRAQMDRAALLQHHCRCRHGGIFYGNDGCVLAAYAGSVEEAGGITSILIGGSAYGYVQ